MSVFISAPETSPEFDELLIEKVNDFIQFDLISSEELFAVDGVRAAMILHFHDEIHRELDERTG